MSAIAPLPWQQRHCQNPCRCNDNASLRLISPPFNSSPCFLLNYLNSPSLPLRLRSSEHSRYCALTVIQGYELWQALLGIFSSFLSKPLYKQLIVCGSPDLLQWELVVCTYWSGKRGGLHVPGDYREASRLCLSDITCMQLQWVQWVQVEFNGPITTTQFMTPIISEYIKQDFQIIDRLSNVCNRAVVFLVF